MVLWRVLQARFAFPQRLYSLAVGIFPMRLLQFSTSHYCRKVRLALGYKKILYEVENLTPGLHILRIKPLTGLTTTPVLLPQEEGQPEAIGDSSQIIRFLETYRPEPPLIPPPPLATEAAMLEDWLDESIGTATRFVYYHFRAGGSETGLLHKMPVGMRSVSQPGSGFSTSPFSQLVIQVVKQQYGITPASVAKAEQRLRLAFEVLWQRWHSHPFLVGNSLSVADITAAALLSPLALVGSYRQDYPWLFDRISEVHSLCGEPLPPGL